MTPLSTSSPVTRTEAAVPPRDWLLLPVLSLLTICGLAVSVEAIARRAFPATPATLASCEVRLDRPEGARAIPNSVCWEKLPEGPLTRYAFNRFGDREDVERGPKAPGAYRIVMTGTSLAIGRYVPRESTLAALLPAELERRTGRKIDVYNESMMQGFPVSTGMRFDEILAAQPDLILWIVVPLDLDYTPEELYRQEPPPLPASAGKARSMERAWYLLKTAYAGDTIAEMVRDHFNRTRTALMLRHVLYESQSRYVESFLKGSQDTEFLRTSPSAEWQKKLEEFDSDANEVASRAKAAGVPLVAVLVPNRAQAAMISMGQWPQGYDPYKLREAIRSTIMRHGGIYIDILPGFRGIANPERDYYPVDGHPDAHGHALLAALIAKGLTDGAAPALKAPGEENIALGQRR